MSRVRLVIALTLLLSLIACVPYKIPAQPLDKKTSERVTQLRKDMLLQRAHALVQYEPIYHELESLLPADGGAADDIEQYNVERNVIAGHLAECGNLSMAEKNYALAEECLDLSNKLVSSNEKQVLLEKARDIRKQQDDKRRSDQIMQAYQHAYNNGSLDEARMQLVTLLALIPENTPAQALREQLAAEIKARMDKDLEEARTLYSQGKITETLAVCNKLLLVDPKNEELIAMINRAEKVNKNIEKLSKPKK